MPLINRLYGILDPSGTGFTTTPEDGLVFTGPTLDIVVSVPSVLARSLADAGKPVPASESGKALIDTGARFTAIDDDAAKKLGLQPTSFIPIVSATHTVQAPVYYIAFDAPVGNNFSMDSVSVVGVNLAPQSLLMLLGRDILRFCQLTYNGTNGSVTVSY